MLQSCCEAFYSFKRLKQRIASVSAMPGHASRKMLVQGSAKVYAIIPLVTNQVNFLQDGKLQPEHLKKTNPKAHPRGLVSCIEHVWLGGILLIQDGCWHLPARCPPTGIGNSIEPPCAGLSMKSLYCTFLSPIEVVLGNSGPKHIQGTLCHDLCATNNLTCWLH